MLLAGHPLTAVAGTSVENEKLRLMALENGPRRASHGVRAYARRLRLELRRPTRVFPSQGSFCPVTARNPSEPEHRWPWPRAMSSTRASTLRGEALLPGDIKDATSDPLTTRPPVQ
jgi:hypothetical protein